MLTRVGPLSEIQGLHVSRARLVTYAPCTAALCHTLLLERFSVYLLFQNQRTHTDALVRTKVQILTPALAHAGMLYCSKVACAPAAASLPRDAAPAAPEAAGTRVTCFTSTKVACAPAAASVPRDAAPAAVEAAGTRVTCFTSTKVQMLHALRQQLYLLYWKSTNTDTLYADVC